MPKLNKVDETSQLTQRANCWVIPLQLDAKVDVERNKEANSVIAFLIRKNFMKTPLVEHTLSVYGLTSYCKGMT